MSHIQLSGLLARPLSDLPQHTGAGLRGPQEVLQGRTSLDRGEREGTERSQGFPRLSSPGVGSRWSPLSVAVEGTRKQCPPCRAWVPHWKLLCSLR